MVLAIIISIILGYLVGNINPSFLFSKKNEFDIRERGSGNAGASNAFITMGAKAGVISGLIDIFKAFLVIKLCARLFPNYAFIPEVAGVSCMLGHMFPIFLGFRGGKGLACLGGMILAFNWKVFVLMLLSEIVLVLLVNYICVVPITASLAFPVIQYSLEGDAIGAAILVLAAFVVFGKHVENLKRIKGGREVHLSYIWNKNHEIDRVKANIEK